MYKDHKDSKRHTSNEIYIAYETLFEMNTHIFVLDDTICGMVSKN